MKMYIADHQIRLIGKAWEVRHQLRRLVSESGSMPVFPQGKETLQTDSNSSRSGSHQRQGSR
ncbi:Z-ring formation inhibitor MciZ [Paenibacillus protaetiae]|uniref:Z-ring formation inhibitor MciZ n=1 Tax=Paenibacillus protaetiae TaxID=2509456 RepID=A0A4P6ETJ4_9BACL|nr:Z-ring formation inhibitor MciZ [Paenibacillus protaetiae]